MNLDKLTNQIIRHEGVQLKPYKCPAGYLTIGAGRNLEGKGITFQEAMDLLQNDIDDCCDDLVDIFSQFAILPENIQHVLVDMRLNLGPNGFREFKKMIQAVKDRDWQGMKENMIMSLWYRQVGDRSKNLVKMVCEVIKEGKK